MSGEYSNPRFELGDGTWALVQYAYPRPLWEYRVFEQNGDFIRRSTPYSSRSEAVQGMERLRDETAPYAAAPGAAAPFGVRHPAHRTGDETTPGQEAVAEVRDGVLSAARKLRHAALTDDDEQRENVADWLEAMFTGITDGQSLRRSAAKASELYRGGAGGFADYGTAVMAEAGHNLGLALMRGRDFPDT